MSLLFIIILPWKFFYWRGLSTNSFPFSVSSVLLVVTASNELAWYTAAAAAASFKKLLTASLLHGSRVLIQTFSGSASVSTLSKSKFYSRYITCVTTKGQPRKLSYTNRCFSIIDCYNITKLKYLNSVKLRLGHKKCMVACMHLLKCLDLFNQHLSHTCLPFRSVTTYGLYILESFKYLIFHLWKCKYFSF